MNGQIAAMQFLGPYKPVKDDEACCWGLPPSCWEEGCDDDGCTGHLGSCLCTCDGGGTTGGEDPALDAGFTADLGPLLAKSGDHIHVSIVAAAGATAERFKLNDSQWATIGHYSVGTAGAKCKRKQPALVGLSAIQAEGAASR